MASRDRPTTTATRRRGIGDVRLPVGKTDCSGRRTAILAIHHSDHPRGAHSHNTSWRCPVACTGLTTSTPATITFLDPADSSDTSRYSVFVESDRLREWLAAARGAPALLAVSLPQPWPQLHTNENHWWLTNRRKRATVELKVCRQNGDSRKHRHNAEKCRNTGMKKCCIR